MKSPPPPAESTNIWYFRPNPKFANINGLIHTRGFAVLDNARSAMAEVESFLMDGERLLTHRSSRVREPRQHSDPLLRLMDAEREIYDELL